MGINRRKNGAILQFSSGYSDVLVDPTSAFLFPIINLRSSAGNPVNAYVLGFGSSFATTYPIDTTVSIQSLVIHGFSFPVSREGTITSISATFFYSGFNENLEDDTARVIAELYHAPAGTTNFQPVPGARVDLGPITSTTLGTLFSGSESVDFDVQLEDRLLMAFFAETDHTGTNNLEILIAGTASGSISIN
ncbi:hypothetical protein [Ammoniphilus sp. CFH 90114]|uniref:hypothetical protein n=1 Tax=Ammoniphilus sp. CFH 90114 TaxID=2493665 RepID=UPI00100E6B39|nr:hypothetical protein [Ammoniphilus sp. CFH 90114]RXT00129.1 hypothetical protein EIZ39_25985 [Ammoniphilus sp. CFH 90114]